MKTQKEFYTTLKTSSDTKGSSKEKYDLVMNMIGYFTENERCNIIMDMIEDLELDCGEEIGRPTFIRIKAQKVVFEK